ncbi:MAG TPA: PspC domain-containing protein, partial [Dermatophilaceae bacterium]|nr:PspC domain-containing protein [Dermatophilaceae bacterium]
GPLPPGPIPPGPPPRAARPDGFWDDLRALGVFRDPHRQWFGGVCAGLAGRWGVDPLLIRAAAVVLTFVGGLGIILYLLAWLFLPDTRGRILAQDVGRGDTVAGVLVAVLAVLVVGALLVDRGPLRVLWWLLPLALVLWLVLRSRRDPTPLIPPTPGDTPMSTTPAGSPWSPPAASPDSGETGHPTTAGYAGPPPGAATAAGPSAGSPAPPPGGSPQGTSPQDPSAYAAQAYLRQPVPPAPYGSAPYGSAPYGSTPHGSARPIAPLQAPPPPRPRRRSASGWFGLVAFGLAVLGFGTGYALDGPTGFPGPAGLLGVVVALAAVALLTLAIGLTGRRAWLPATITWVLCGAALLGAVGTGVSRSAGPGETVSWRPTTVQGQADFRLSAGEGTLDLTALDLSTATPTDPVAIDLSVGAGQVTIVLPTGMDATVDAQVGLGSIQRVPGTGPGADQPLTQGGVGQRTTLTFGDGPPTVRIHAALGAGELVLKEI